MFLLTEEHPRGYGYKKKKKQNSFFSLMGLDATKPVFGVSDKARHQPVSSATV